jgi:hypothetical protein
MSALGKYANVCVAGAKVHSCLFILIRPHLSHVSLILTHIVWYSFFFLMYRMLILKGSGV